MIARLFPLLPIAALATIAAAPGRAAAADPPRTEARTGERAEPSDDVRPTSRLVWLDGEAGVQTANLNTFTADWERFSVGFIPRSGTGPAFGAAAGLRIVFLTIGLRGRVASFQNDDPTQAVRGWTMSSLNGELGIRVPLRRLEPFATVGAGYTTFGGFGEAVRGIGAGMNVNGANARAGLGFDYFVAQNVSLGLAGTAEVLALTRPGIPVRSVAALPQSDTLSEAAVRFLAANGSSYGAALALTGGLKAHF